MAAPGDHGRGARFHAAPSACRLEGGRPRPVARDPRQVHGTTPEHEIGRPRAHPRRCSDRRRSRSPPPSVAGTLDALPLRGPGATRRGTTMVLVGLPLVLLGRYLPERVQTWRRGAFHTHEGGEEHRHLHSHALHRSHEHIHDAPLRALRPGPGRVRHRLRPLVRARRPGFGRLPVLGPTEAAPHSPKSRTGRSVPRPATRSKESRGRERAREARRCYPWRLCRDRSRSSPSGR